MTIELNSIKERLRTLQAEYNKGLQQLAGLRRKQDETRQTILRIEGAIQIMEEILKQNLSTPEEKPIAAVQ